MFNKIKKYLLLTLFSLAANHLPLAATALYDKYRNWFYSWALSNKNKDKIKALDQENYSLFIEIKTFFVDKYGVPKYGKSNENPISQFLRSYNTLEDSKSPTKFDKDEEEFLKSIEGYFFGRVYLLSHKQKSVIKKANKGLSKDELEEKYFEEEVKLQYEEYVWGSWKKKYNIRLRWEAHHIIKAGEDLKKYLSSTNKKLKEISPLIPKTEEKIHREAIISSLNEDEDIQKKIQTSVKKTGGVTSQLSNDKKKIIMLIQRDNKKTMELDIGIDKEIIEAWKELHKKLMDNGVVFSDNSIEEKVSTVLDNNEMFQQLLTKEILEVEKREQLEIMIPYMYSQKGENPISQYRRMLNTTVQVYRRREDDDKEAQMKVILQFNEALKKDLKFFNDMIEGYQKGLDNEEILESTEKKKNDLEVEAGIDTPTVELEQQGVIEEDTTEEDQNSSNEQQEPQNITEVPTTTSLLGTTPVPSDANMNEIVEKSTLFTNKIQKDVQSLEKNDPLGISKEENDKKEPEQNTAPLLLLNESKTTKSKGTLSKKTNRNKTIKRLSTLGIIFIIGSVAVALIGSSKKKFTEREVNNDNENE